MSFIAHCLITSLLALNASCITLCYNGRPDGIMAQWHTDILAYWHNGIPCCGPIMESFMFVNLVRADGLRNACPTRGSYDLLFIPVKRFFPIKNLRTGVQGFMHLCVMCNTAVDVDHLVPP